MKSYVFLICDEGCLKMLKSMPGPGELCSALQFKQVYQAKGSSGQAWQKKKNPTLQWTGFLSKLVVCLFRQ